jgi:AraC-like DNA-binding protein
VTRAEERFTIGQQCCYVLWEQYDGLTWLERGGEKWQLGPEQVFLAEPGTRARWRGPARVTRLVFDVAPRPRRLNREGCSYPIRWTPQPGWQDLFGCPLRHEVPGAWADRARDLIALASHSDRRHDTLGWLAIGLRLGLWLTDYARFLSGPRPDKPGKTPSLVKAAEAILARGFDPRASVAEVARQLGVSRGHLTRQFQRERGFGPGRFRLQMQVRTAQKLLVDTDYRLPRIAVRAGFSGPSSLRRAFGQVVGVSPSRWREEQQRLILVRRPAAPAQPDRG